ncbi:MAG: hypothetical protein AAF840_01185 [Bacteroidota bacterium]
MIQPNSLHSGFIRDSLLQVYQQRWAFLIVMLVFSGIGVLAFIGLDAPRALWRLYRTQKFNLEALQVLTGSSAFLLFLFTGIIGLRSPLPRRFQVQNFVFWPRILVNLFTGLFLLLLMLTALMATYEALTSSLIPEAVDKVDLKANQRSWVAYGGLCLVIFLVGASGCFWLFRRTLGYFNTYWQHVRLTAYFDQESYYLGERINFSLKDRQSAGSERAYRIHLNYVREQMIGGHKEQRLERKILWSAYQDTTAGQLHEGISVDLPLNENVASYITNVGKRLPIHYWEVLVEGPKPHFYARYFLQVGLVAKSS